MDTKLIVDIVSSHCKMDSIRKDGFLRAEQQYHGRPMAVHFVDWSNRLGDPHFDFEQYLEQNVAAEYYSTRGNLQWNLYLYFICGEQVMNALRRSGSLSALEKNTLYARTYVIGERNYERELERYLAWPLPTSSASSESQAGDLSSFWIETLRNAELDGVYLPTRPAYRQVVDHYLKAAPRDNVDSQAQPATAEEPIIRSIDSIDLQRYRPYPIKRGFSFSKLNLLEGTNGSGKTSLLEAIEYGLCGQSLRSINEPNPNYKVTLSINGNESVLTSDAMPNSRYRKRDRIWYGNDHAQGNYLCESFNRVNYFNTDAAIDVAGRTRKGDIQESLARLITGEFASVLDERARRILEVFEELEGPYGKRLKALLLQSDALKRQIEACDTIAAQRASIADQIKRCGWILDLPPDSSEAWRSISHSLNLALAASAELQADIHMSSDVTPLSLRSQLVLSRSIFLSLNEIKTALGDAEAIIRDSTDRAVAETSKLQTLIQFRRYLITPNAYMLPEMSARMSQLERKRSEITHIRDFYEQKRALLTGLAGVEQPLDEFHRSLTLSLRQANAEFASIEATLAQRSAGKDAYHRLHQQILSMARELISAHGDLGACPVCSTRFTPSVLSERIAAAIPDDSAADIDDQLMQKQRVLQETIARTNQQIDLVGLMKTQLSEDMHAQSVRLIVDYMARATETSVDLDAAIRQCEEFLKRFEADQMSESEYTHLRVQCDQYFQDVGGTVDSQTIETLIIRTEQQIKSLDSQKISAEPRVMSLNMEMKKLLSAWEGSPSVFQRTHAGTERAQQLIEIVSAQLTWEDTTSFGDVLLRIETVRAAIERAEGQISTGMSNRQQGELKAELREVENELASLHVEMERRKSAADVLKNLLENHNREQYAAEYVQKHFLQIGSIFTMIHAPMEFIGIEFNNKNECPMLKECASEKATRSLDQISSGQRSAFALSVFLTMNLCALDAPRLMLFDDPVAHIDDINILSFLDFVRLLVIEHDRQIFFATANQHVAALFKRKFSFLDEELTCYRLERG